jgi:hypothetical protein
VHDKNETWLSFNTASFVGNVFLYDGCLIKNMPNYLWLCSVLSVIMLDLQCLAFICPVQNMKEYYKVGSNLEKPALLNGLI